MEYQVRKASQSDLPGIMKIYEQARRFMAEQGNPHQWGLHHPPESLLKKDIREGNLYVLLENKTVHGVFAFLLGEDPTYAVIHDGAWHRAVPYGTIHRIAGDGSGDILHGAVSYCETMIEYLRIDTHADNFPMQKAIAKEGFQKCGIIFLPDGNPRIAYDR